MMPTASAVLSRWSLLCLWAAAAMTGCGDGDRGDRNEAWNVRLDSSVTSTRCLVTIGYLDRFAIDLADLTVDYSGADGDFGPARYAARCRSLAKDATRTVAFNECESAACLPGERRFLRLGLGFGQDEDELVLETPADLFECEFEGDGASLASLSGAVQMSGPGLQTFDSGPVEVRVECDGWRNSTTTTTSTTSTLPCAGGPCEEGDLLPIQIWLDDAVTLGALQFDVGFPSEVGAFDQYPAAKAVRCALHPGVDGLFATNQVPRIDDPACQGCRRRLAVGFAFGAGHRGPGPLATCDFLVGARAPTVEDFTLEMRDVASPDGVPMNPIPGVSLRGFPRP
jgi:hypothetical protein